MTLNQSQQHRWSRSQCTIGATRTPARAATKHPRPPPNDMPGDRSTAAQHCINKTQRANTRNSKKTRRTRLLRICTQQQKHKTDTGARNPAQEHHEPIEWPTQFTETPNDSVRRDTATQPSQNYASNKVHTDRCAARQAGGQQSTSPQRHVQTTSAHEVKTSTTRRCVGHRL